MNVIVSIALILKLFNQPVDSPLALSYAFVTVSNHALPTDQTYITLVERKSFGNSCLLMILNTFVLLINGIKYF